MMSTVFNTTFRNHQAHKIDQLIKTYGQSFSFMRLQLNDFGEPDLEQEPERYTIEGVYHEENTYVHRTDLAVDSGTIRSRSSPMLLIRASDASLIKIGDVMSYNSKRFLVMEIKNVSERDFAVDISLEEVQPDGHEFPT